MLSEQELELERKKAKEQNQYAEEWVNAGFGHIKEIGKDIQKDWWYGRQILEGTS